VKFRLASLPGFDSPTLLSKNTARMGDEGKAVGCVPPTALLFEQALNTRSTNQIRDQRDRRDPSCPRCCWRSDVLLPNGFKQQPKHAEGDDNAN
jgi:hypothetical protein